MQIGRTAYRPNLASTLTNLGALYGNTGRLADAEKAYSEALTIYRDLASSNPTRYTDTIASLTKVVAILHIRARFNPARR